MEYIGLTRAAYVYTRHHGAACVYLDMRTGHVWTVTIKRAGTRTGYEQSPGIVYVTGKGRTERTRKERLTQADIKTLCDIAAAMYKRYTA